MNAMKRLLSTLNTEPYATAIAVVIAAVWMAVLYLALTEYVMVLR